MNSEVEIRSRFISNVLSPIWFLRSPGLHVKVGSESASKRCRRNGTYCNNMPIPRFADETQDRALYT